MKKLFRKFNEWLDDELEDEEFKSIVVEDMVEK